MERLNGENTNGLVVERNVASANGSAIHQEKIARQLIDSLDNFKVMLTNYIETSSNEHLIRAMIAPILEERLENFVGDALDNLPWDDLINTHLDTSDISRDVVEYINDEPSIIEDAVKCVVNNSDFSIHNFELELR